MSIAEVKRVLVIDLSSLYWTDALGTHAEDRGPLHRTISAVGDMAADYDRVAICTDSGRSWRTKHWPKYKAGRAERAPHLWRLLEETTVALDRMGYHVFRAPELEPGLFAEADDLVATVCQWCEKLEIQVDIFSSDSDLTQCVSPDVTLIRRGKTGIERLDVDGVERWVGVQPHKVAELKALAGDTGDGYGDLFNGLGKESASKLLAKYSDIWLAIDAVLAVGDTAVDTLTRPERILREGGRESVNIGMFLATVRRDIPIDCDSLREPRERKPYAANLESAPPADDGDAEAKQAAESAPPAEETARASITDRQEGAPGSAPLVKVVGNPTNGALVTAVTWDMALEPKSMQSAHWIAQQVYASSLWPRKFSTPQAALMVIMAGRARGISVFDSLNGIHVIEGVPTFGAHLIIAMVRHSKAASYLDLVESDDNHALWITKRKGSKVEQKRSYTFDQAMKAGRKLQTQNGKDTNWVTNREDMLIKTAGSKLCRSVYQDIVGASLATEEWE